MKVVRAGFFFCAYYLIGLAGLFYSLKACVFRVCAPGSVALLPGQLPPLFYPQTRQVIVFYMVLVLFLFVYFLHALYTVNGFRAGKMAVHKPALCLTAFLALNLLIGAAAAKFQAFSLALLSLWLLALLGILRCCAKGHFPFLDFAMRFVPTGAPRILKGISFLQRKTLGIAANRGAPDKQFATLFLAVLIGELIWVLSPFIVSTPALLDDFLDIPETTLMTDQGKPIEVDNHCAIQKFTLLGDKFTFRSPRPKEETDALMRQVPGKLDTTMFLKKNRMEMCWQTLTRGFIHHHNHVLAPVNELALGRPVKDIFAQYGWGHAFFMKSVMEWMPNGLCYGNYIRLHFLGYLVYYFLFLALLFHLVKDVRLVTALFAISVISVNAMHQYLWLGPGTSPIRHVFDVPVIYFLARHLTSLRFRYLYAVLLSCILGVFFNTQFGAILFLSALGCQMVLLCWPGNAVSWAYKKRMLSALLIGGAGLVSSVCFFSCLGAKDIVSGYFLSGVLGFPIHGVALFLIAACILAGYLAWILIPKEVPMAKRAMSLFLLWYAQLMLLYYVRGAVIYMLLPILPLILLAVVYLLLQLGGESGRIENNKNNKGYRALYVGVTLLLVYAFCDAVAAYQNEFRKQFVHAFSQHKTYRWDMERAKFISTMDPRYFERSLRLLALHTQDEKGIFIISKYDRFIPFIAGRYSAMPFFDLEWFLITQKEIDHTVEFLKEKKPRYLFVDTDIDCDFAQSQVVGPKSSYAGFGSESLWRAERLRCLKTVFDAVRGDYERGEAAELLTVYFRKDMKNPVHKGT